MDPGLENLGCLDSDLRYQAKSLFVTTWGSSNRQEQGSESTGTVLSSSAMHTSML